MAGIAFGGFSLVDGKFAPVWIKRNNEKAALRRDNLSAKHH